MTTEEGNKIIDVWMGARVLDANYKHLWKAIFNDDSRKCNDYERKDRRVYFAAQLKYHSSFDWLMPVVEKIADFTIRESGKIKIFSAMDFSISIGQFSSRRHHVIVTGSITEVGGTEESHEYNKISVPKISIAKDGVNAIESVWLAVIQFIEWHNKQEWQHTKS